MKLIMANLTGSSFNWIAGMISITMLIAFSSCSTNREASLAYMDDIYKPYDVDYLMTYYNEQGGVSDQNASVIKPYRPTVPDYTPYTKPINFNMSFGYGYNSFYSGGYGYYCKPYGYYPRYYYSYARSYRGCYSPDWYMLPYVGNNYSYYPYYNYGYGDYGNSSGGSYIYGNNVSYFHGINSSERYEGSGVNYSKYVYYRASGSSGVTNTGRQSGSSGKSRYGNISNSDKSNTKKSSNYFNSSNYNSNKSYQSSPSGRSASPSQSRSTGSGGGSYTGKRPR